ncbi:MAG: hypothetical protein VYC39_07270 [Myxococcota bacterium]|nr:hypothetical protein [Myxococcota bacterium]
MKKARQLPVQLALSVVAVLAMSAACTVDTNTARRKTGGNSMEPADTGTNMNSSLDAGVIADSGSGMQSNCSDNPSMCVPRELRGNPPTCACLGVCEQGWQWQNGVCVQNGMMGTPDAGTGGGGPSVDGGVPATDPFDPATVASQYASAICSFRTRCEPALHDFFSSNEMECVTELGTSLRSQYEAFAQIIAANRLGFSQTGLNNCIQALSTADCASGPAPQACSSVFTGSQGAGQPCSLQSECTSDTFCAVQSLGECATCQPRAQAGQDCSGALCVAGTDCLQLQDGRNLCIPDTAGEGQPCGQINTGLCRGRLQCIGDMAATCQRPVARGGMCPTPDAMGNISTPTCNIYQNDTCVGNQCVAVTWGGAGTTCGDPATADNCNATAYCSSQMGPGTCTGLPGMGAACYQGRCAEGNYCAGASCAPEKTAGVACAGSAECSSADNLFCVSGSCGPLTYNFCQ